MHKVNLKGEGISFPLTIDACYQVMGIILDLNNLRAHLFTDKVSYVVETFEGELLHSYWGQRIDLPNISPLIPIEEFCSFYPNPNPENPTYSLDVLPREFPDFGRSDYRNPSVRIRLGDGTAITKFLVESFKICDEKPELKGLPSTYTEAGDRSQTLEVTLKDEKSGIIAKLYYTVSEDYHTITRHVLYENTKEEAVFIETALSANVDFYNDTNFDLIHFSGAWARERHFTRVNVGKATNVIESKRGSSSHMQNPLVLLARPETNDLSGEVYSMNLVYSGSFKSVVEVNSFNSTRFQMGINDFDFKWKLSGGDSFTTPEVVMVYSNEGFNGMSNSYHRLYRERLTKGKFRDLERPVLINNWEATYFNFTEEKLNAIGKAAGELGVEMFVLDDGWFGVRNSDQSGLGDWFVNRDKLTGGLSKVASDMKKENLEFGLWFEPEMVSPDSDLYRAHPNWILHTPSHSRTMGRGQCVLDFSRRDVQDYIIKVVGDILRAHPITYLKWDMNRNMTEVNSELLSIDRQGEVTHRYILGLYRVLRKLTHEFSHILFESCSGGGGRFDPGMLYYMPQTWTSDDTDAHERIAIQYGTSFAYPPITMGAHVSVAPNHQVGRFTMLERRGLTSMMANLGYELDLSSLTNDEKNEVAKQISYYKSIRKDIQFGNFFRLLPIDSEIGNAFLTESPDKKRYYLFYFRGLNQPHVAKTRLPLTYLSEGNYKVEKKTFAKGTYAVKDANGDIIEVELGEKGFIYQDQVLSASFLNGFGITVQSQQYDFDGQLYVFEKII